MPVLPAAVAAYIIASGVVRFERVTAAGARRIIRSAGNDALPRLPAASGASAVARRRGVTRRDTQYLNALR